MTTLRRLLRLAAILAATALLLPLGLASRLLRFCGLADRAMRTGARVQALWCACLLRGMGVHLDLPAREATHPGPFFVVANHLSYVDILVLGTLFPGRFVAKSEIGEWPLVGFLSRCAGTIFVVQRHRRDLVRVGEEIDRTLAAGVNVLLFPEGGSSRGVRIARLHPALFESAVRLDLPCVAVALGYDTPEDPWAPAATVCWWGGMSLPRHLWRLIGLRRITARLRWSAEPVRSGDRKELAQALREALEARFRPIRQDPIAPDYPWPELFADDAPG